MSTEGEIHPCKVCGVSTTNSADICVQCAGPTRSPTHCPHCRIPLRLWDNTCPNCERGEEGWAMASCSRPETKEPAAPNHPPAPKGMVYCRVCQKAVAEAAATCPHCGLAHPAPGWGTAISVVGGCSKAILHLGCAGIILFGLIVTRGCGLF